MRAAEARHEREEPLHRLANRGRRALGSASWTKEGLEVSNGSLGSLEEPEPCPKAGQSAHEERLATAKEFSP